MTHGGKPKVSSATGGAAKIAAARGKASPLESEAWLDVPIDFTSDWIEVDPNNLLTIVDADSLSINKLQPNTYGAVSCYKDFGAAYFNDKTRLRFKLTVSNGGVFGVLVYLAFSNNTTPLTAPDDALVMTIYLNSADAWVTVDVDFSMYEYINGGLGGSGSIAKDLLNVGDPYSVWTEILVDPVADTVWLRFYSDEYSTSIFEGEISSFNEATWLMQYLFMNSTYFSHDTNYQGKIDMDDVELAKGL